MAQRVSLTVDTKDGVDGEAFVKGLQRLVANTYGGSIDVLVRPAEYATFSNITFVGVETVDEPTEDTPVETEDAPAETVAA